jgi:hypothetical protein
VAIRLPTPPQAQGDVTKPPQAHDGFASAESGRR